MITAVFDKNQDCVYAIEKLWQWDYGRKLRIQGLSLPDAVEIQFSLQETGGEATPRIGLTRDGVTDVVIPDFIAEGDGATANYDAYAFIYLTDDTSGRTLKKIKIRVLARSKPEGYKGGGSTTMADILKAVNEAIASGGVSDEQIEAAVESYLDANPIEEQDPTVPGWAKAETKPTYTAVEVGADPVGTADAKVAAHNTATDAHNDIRLLIDGLTTRLNALADSDDTTLDQMSEVVAYIKSNKSLIDAITTNKVSVSDIIDNLTTNVSNKPLSAAQGVALKALIDAIVVPEKLPNPSALTIKQGDTEVSYDGSGAVTVTIPESSGGKSAYQYAVEGGYTGTETEFAAKLAEEMPDKLPNPYALTINGTSYDGSNAVNVTVTGESGGNGWSKVAEFEYNLNDELIVDSFTSENKYLHFTTAHGLAVGDYLLIREPHIILTSKCGYTTVTDIIDENTVVCDSITNTSDFSGNFIVEKSAGRVLFNYSGLITKPFARMRISGTTIFLSGKNWTYSAYYQSYGGDCLMGESDNKVTSGNSIVAVKGLPYCGQVTVNAKRYNGGIYIVEEDGVYSFTYTRHYSPIPEKHVYTPQLVFNGLRIIVEEADEWDIP